MIPAGTRAQNTGVVDCARSGGYVYLYSSVATLDVRSTLQCGEHVQITKREDKYYGVRTASGDIGFVPLGSITLLKDTPGSSVTPPAPKPARPRISYDAPAAADTAPLAPVGPDFTLPNNTVVHLKLSKALNSASAHVGDHVQLEVTEDVVVEGFLVFSKGAVGTGVITDAEPKKRMGHGGKLGVSLKSVKLANDETAPVRGYQEASAGTSATGTVLPMVSGKDVAFAPGAEFTGWVDGNVHLKREAFAVGKDAPSAPPSPAPSVPPPPNPSALPN